MQRLYDLQQRKSDQPRSGFSRYRRASAMHVPLPHTVHSCTFERLSGNMGGDELEGREEIRMQKGGERNERRQSLCLLRLLREENVRAQPG